MYYITLDLEWNQAYAEKALAVQKRLSCRLRGEVIQIGAVKLDRNMALCGSYSVIVKPKWFKHLHKHVSALTGITQEQIDLGMPLPEAVESFRNWCGDDFAFLTWGPDDIPMLKDNLHAHGADFSWLNCAYDMQPMFNEQTDGLRKQRSLEYAMEYYHIEQKLPAHDALNDAFFTALVAQKLDVVKGITDIRIESENELLSETFGDADAGEDDGYVTVEELLAEPSVGKPDCPICGGKLEPLGTPLHMKGQKYLTPFRCKRDGELMQTLRLHRNFNDTWRARRTIERATEEAMKNYQDGLRASRAFRAAKSTGRKRRRSGKKKTAAKAEAK